MDLEKKIRKDNYAFAFKEKKSDEAEINPNGDYSTTVELILSVIILGYFTKALGEYLLK